ncbi:hypothetical protein L873DRAFT_1705102 [Choiromyces venosus 120613-1]|uniref:Uncharacterized protein n=1 Tax=Choiromyces venosus 120613-1 TaxID=1336337 RepID=A0A3N4J579_9PEZI|nr:hypothetical protein L873DRAFT_1705102 [Choiromyces venosus 120613-1]
MHTLENHLRLLDPYSPYLQWFEGEVDDGKRTQHFFYRNILDCVRYLLRQIAYRDDLVYMPRCEYDQNGDRIYAKMHTADWWWDVQDTLPRGATLVPIIGMSDQTHLTNFSGDKKAWPVYITTGNLLSTRRNRPGSMAVLLLALLPVPPKFPQSSSADNLQRQINAGTLQGVFELILSPLQDAALDGVSIDCVDRKVRQCFPILSVWVADHMENVALQRTRNQGLRRDMNTTFDALGITMGRNVFHGLQQVSAPDLHKPDLLHTVYLGLFKHMMDWVQGFLKKHA